MTKAKTPVKASAPVKAAEVKKEPVKKVEEKKVEAKKVEASVLKTKTKEKTFKAVATSASSGSLARRADRTFGITI